MVLLRLLLFVLVLNAVQFPTLGSYLLGSPMLRIGFRKVLLYRYRLSSSVYFVSNGSLLCIRCDICGAFDNSPLLSSVPWC